MKCVILGAGKIARGFIGHLLYLNNIPFTFIEKAPALVELINSRGQYTVNILGAPEKNCVVQGAKALCLDDTQAAVAAIRDADTVFTSVGGKNLEALVPLLTKAVEEKAKLGGSLNIVTCENWKLPADILRGGIEKAIAPEAADYLQNNVGITEAVIMRSAIESEPELLKKDPLVVNVQDYWVLPVDASRVVGQLPPIAQLQLIESFTGFLERKFYTYNAANGTTSFVGAILGYKYIADAAHDARILEILDGVYKETATALSKKHDFPFEEQWAFTRTSLNKLRDRNIVDYIERNARDPMRKLGPDDRLVGSARLCMDYGVVPENLAVAIACAIHYEQPTDEFAVQLKQLREEKGIGYVIENVCKLDPNGALGKLILQKVEQIRSWGWIQ